MTQPVDLFDDPNLTFSKLCAAWLLNLDARMMIGGFATQLCQAVAATNGPVDKDELKSLVARYRIIPDGYLIDIAKKTAYLFEIEDTNPLSANKLRKLSEIWWRLDSIGWEMRVFLIDRYLTCWRSLPLAEVWHSLEYPHPGADPAVRRSHSAGPAINWEATYLQSLQVAINRPVFASEVLATSQGNPTK